MLSIEQEGSVRVILAGQLQWKSLWQSSPHRCFEKRKIDEGRVGEKCGSLCIVENILPLCIFSYSTCQRQLLCFIELVDSYNLYPFFFFFSRLKTDNSATSYSNDSTLLGLIQMTTEWSLCSQNCQLSLSFPPLTEGTPPILTAQSKCASCRRQWRMTAGVRISIR